MSQTSYVGSVPDNIELIQRDSLSTNNQISNPKNHLNQCINDQTITSENNLFNNDNKILSKISMFRFI